MCFKRPYLTITCMFLIWILVVDSNNICEQLKIFRQILKCKERIKVYKKEIDLLKTRFSDLSDSFEIEKKAREYFYMHKPNEKIIVIEYRNK